MAGRLQRPLRRLAAMTQAELRWRATVAARTAAARLAARLRAPQWDRGSIGRALDRRVSGDAVRAAIDARDWSAVHAALADRLRARPARFVIDPAAAPRLREVVRARWPGAPADARTCADTVRGGEYDLLGYRGLRFDAPGGGIDWHADPVHARRAPRVFHADVPYLDAAVGDHKIIWEINRHQHWLRLGRAAWLADDAAYTAPIVEQLEDWMAQNPPGIGINWASMLEVAFRSLSWTWALHCLLALPDPGTRPWIVDLLIGLDRQLTHVERNLSYYFSPNTHLTGEALALYVAGVALPELAASTRWKTTGRRVLLTEIDRQILPDGGHAERSAHYQRYTLDFYLLALLSAGFDGDDEAASRFGAAALSLARFTRTLADDSGRLPLLGDDDGGMLWPLTGRACADVRDSLAVAAAVLGQPELAPWGAVEEVAWIAGPEAADAAAGRLENPPDSARPAATASATVSAPAFSAASAASRVLSDAG